MTYPEVINYLYRQLPMFSRVGAPAFKKDLSNIRALCDALGNPEKRFKSIHVGGTNGKGSVSHMLAAIFQESGYKTGLHTSPHLIDFRERIRVDGVMAEKDFVIHFVEDHQELIARLQPSFFEISVAMAFQWFAEEDVDIAIVEVGLGGRLDSTNILSPELSVITNISLEHTQILGHTRALIAGEKAGIIKPHTPVVIGETHEETQPVFLEKAKEQQAEIAFADQQFIVQGLEATSEGQGVKVGTQNGDEWCFFIDLGGRYQLQNVRTVCGALEMMRQREWILPPAAVQKALGNVKMLTGLHGRWEILGQKPLFIADTSHNTAGLQQVLQQLRELRCRRMYIIIGFVKDKNVKEILSLFPPEAFYFFCQAKNPRALETTALKEMAGEAGLEGKEYFSVEEAVQAAKAAAEEDSVVLLTGSTFIVAEALQEKNIVI